MKRKFTDLDKAERIVLQSMLRNPKTDEELQEWLEELDEKEETDPFIFMVTFVIVLFIIILISSLMP